MVNRASYLLFLWIFLPIFCPGQNPSAPIFSNAHLPTIESDAVKIDSFCGWFIDTTANLSLGEIAQADFRPYQHEEIQQEFKNFQHHLWLSMDIQGPWPDSISEFEFYWGKLDWIKLYQIPAGTKDLAEIEKNPARGGNFIGSVRAANPANRFYIPIRLKDSTRYRVLVQIRPLRRIHLSKEGPTLHLPASAYARQINEYLEHRQILLFSLMTIGILLFMVLINTGQFLFSYEKTYIYYAGYILAHVCYFTLILEDLLCLQVSIFAWFPYVLNSVSIACLFLSYSLYNRFVRNFLNLKEVNRRIDKIFIRISQIFFDFFILVLVAHLVGFKGKTIETIEFSLLGLTIPLGLYGYYLLFKLEGPLVKYIKVGTGIFIVGSTLGFLLYLSPFREWLRFPWPGPKLFSYHLFYTKIGVLFEVLLFSIGLAYRAKLVEKENLSNILAKKQLEQEKLASNFKQIQLTQAKELEVQRLNMFTQITHEFKTPLTVILGLSQELIQNPKHKLQSSLNTINANGKRMTYLVRQIMDLARLSSGKIQLDPIRDDIAIYLRRTTEMFESLAGTKQIRISFHADPEHIMMDYDPKVMDSIMTNLISNAIKFIPEDYREKRIQVVVKQIENHGLTISVRDSGIGIPADKIESLFQPFFQVGGASRPQKGEGSGLGLAIVKQSAELMKGRVKVESTQGKGSTFEVFLPFRDLKAPEGVVETHQIPYYDQLQDIIVPQVREEQAELDQLGDLPKVLVVEDNPDLIDLMRSYLSPNFQVMESWNGEEGLVKARKYLPDLVISDVMMPNMDGYELCKILKEDPLTRHISVMLLTARTAKADRLHGLSQGADAYLDKPFDKAELMILAENLIRESQLKKSAQEKSGLLWEGHTITGEFEQKVFDVLADNYTNPFFGVALLASKLHMSEATLGRRLKKSSEIFQTPATLLQAYRLKIARGMVQKSEMALYEIAREVGISDPSTFSRIYKEKFGVHPSHDRSK